MFRVWLSIGVTSCPMLPVRLFSRECDGEMNWAGECGAEDVLGVGDVVQECVVVDDAELFVRV